MTLYYAAAVALVGWYLVVPQLSKALWGFDPYYPLDRWPEIERYDSDADCEAARSKASDYAKSEGDHLVFARYGFSRCIFGDEPRLGPR